MSGGQLELQFHKRPKRVRGAKPLAKGARMRIIETPDMTSWSRADVGVVGTIGDPYPMKDRYGRRGARDVIGYYYFFPDDGQKPWRHSDEPIAVTSLQVEPVEIEP
ncbi:MAG TPA: hypothetical protein VF761_16745 [Gemmatimonadaceae bacterium]